MLLPDFMITSMVEGGVLGIDPFDPKLVQPASVDLRLHHLYRRPKFDVRHLDVADIPEGHTDLRDAYDSDGRIELGPGELILGCTGRGRQIVQHGRRVCGVRSSASLIFWDL